MGGVVWSPAALQDIDRLRRFLAAQDQKAAHRAIGKIRTAIGTLSRHPEAGRLTPDLGADVREWLIPFGRSFYLALYRAYHGGIIILAIRHAREAGYLLP